MPPEAMWPQGRRVGHSRLHANRRAGWHAWREAIDKNYGGADNVADWVELSQFINYDGYSRHFRGAEQEPYGRSAVDEPPLLPSFVWQTYDYYFDPTAGYFGSKKGAEPLHIQWNPLTNAVEVVNYNAGGGQGPEGAGRHPQHGWQSEMGEERLTGQRRRQRGISHPAEFPADLTGGALLSG